MVHGASLGAEASALGWLNHIPSYLPLAGMRWKPQPRFQSLFMVNWGSCWYTVLRQGRWRGRQAAKGAAVGQGLGRAGRARAEVGLGVFQGELYRMCRESLDCDPKIAEILAAHPDLLGDR